MSWKIDETSCWDPAGSIPPGKGVAASRNRVLRGPAVTHHIDLAFLREAYRRVRKDGAVGVDGQTAAEYEIELQDNLQSLLNRFKSGSYRAGT